MSFIIAIIATVVFGVFSIFGSLSNDHILNIMSIIAIPLMVISAYLAYHNASYHYKNHQRTISFT